MYRLCRHVVGAACLAGNPFQNLLAKHGYVFHALPQECAAIAGRVDPWNVAIGFAMSIGLLGVSRWFWKQGLKHYSGASA